MGRTRVAVAVLAIVGLVLSAGCGSKKNASSPPAPTTTTTTTTTATSASAGGSSGRSIKPSFASTKNCAQLASLASRIASSGNPTGGKVDLNRYSDAMDALANAAPDEIRPDFKTFADALKDFARAMSDAGLKPGETPTAAQIAKLTAASQKLSTPKFRAATEHLEAWGQKNCGFSSTNP
jgi:hypothetical protein